MTRVLIVDDEALVRAGLRMILQSAADLEIVGEIGDGADAVTAVRALRPDVVLMDIRMPRLDGLAATAAVRALDDPPEVVVLTTFDLDDYVFRALQAGASGFLLKDTPPLELLAAVRVVAAGESMLSPTVTRRLITHFAADPRAERRRVAGDRVSLLTEREREAAQLAANGDSNLAIATALGITERTVKAHLKAVFEKLQVADRLQLALRVHGVR